MGERKKETWLVNSHFIRNRAECQKKEKKKKEERRGVYNLREKLCTKSKKGVGPI